MGVQEGLDAIKAYKDEQERRKEAASASKVEWLNIPNGKTYEVRFLQELDKSGAGYSEKNGLGFFATEHSNPDDFRRKALCTIESGQCYGCEQSKAAYKAGDNERGGKWRAKSRLYINVLFRDEKGKEAVAVMSQPNGSKSVIAPMVLDQAVEEGTITDRWWKIKRTGEKSETTYIPRVGQPVDDVNLDDYDVFDLKAGCVRDVPYDEQAAHYNPAPEQPSEVENSGGAGTPVDTSDEW